MYDNDDLECQACIDASQCVDSMEVTEMARRKRRVVVRKRPQPVEPPPVVEEEETVEAEADTEDYTQLSIPQLREECEHRGLEKVGRKSVLIRRLMEDDDSGADEEESEEEAAPAPVVKRRTKKAKPAAKQEEEVVTTSVADLLDAMDTGAILVLTRLDDNRWTLAKAGLAPATAEAYAEPAPQGKKLRGDAFWKEVLTPEYYNFYYVDAGDGAPWSKMSKEEKFDFADNLGVEWEEQEDERVEFMKMVKAIFDELGIVKYKDEYKSSASRKALR